jgi:hypothetical protein
MNMAETHDLTTNIGDTGTVFGGFELGHTLLAVALAVSHILLVSLLAADMARVVLAMQLAVIGGIYIGFGIADGRLSAIAVEATQAGLFFAIALGGVWHSWWCLVAGYFAHGLWDCAHHSHGVPTNVPAWYVPACVVYDWLVAAFIVVAYAL